MRQPADDFATAAREILERERAAGRQFPDAWAAVEREVRPLDAAGWGTLEGRDHDGLETPLAFLYRHLRAAYVGRAAGHYCADDCAGLAAPASAYCARHA